MKPRKIFIGLPCYDGWSPKFAASLYSALPGAPPAILHTLDGDSLIPRARNNLAAEFLESDATHLLFLDTDLEFSREGLHRLIAHDRDVVGGVYFQKRHDRLIPVLNGHEGHEIGENGTQQVKHLGTGLMLIARHVFERLIEGGAVKRYFSCDDEAKQRWSYDFFPIGVGPDERYESEDWAFCRLVEEAGMEVWADWGFQARHHGHGVYPCEPVEQMRQQVRSLRDALEGLVGASQWLMDKAESVVPGHIRDAVQDGERVAGVSSQQLQETGRR